MMVGTAEGEGLAVVIFHLGGQTFGFDSRHVAEVVPNAWLSRPPVLPSMVAGLLDLGGELVSVLRGDRLLGLPEQNFGLDASILIMRKQGRRVGVLAGPVGGVRELAACRQLAMDAADSFRGCVRAQLDNAGLVVHLLDWERLLNAEEAERLDEFQDRAAQHLQLWQDPAP